MIGVGTNTIEYYEAPYHKWYQGRISAIGRGAWTITYADGSTLVLHDEREIRNTVDVCSLPQWQTLVSKVKGAFEYLECRLTDKCAAPYCCKEQHRIAGLLRAFNPSFASGNVDALWVRQLANLPCFSHIAGVADQLTRELPEYLVACQGAKIEHRDVSTFTKDVLQWWAFNHTKLPTWSLAARIAFCLSPNSASCERVFSLFVVAVHVWC